MKIRKADEKDLSLISGIDVGSGDPMDRIFPTTLESQNAHHLDQMKKGTIYFLCDDKGFIAVRQFVGFRNAEIYYLSVKEQEHRKGIGTALLMHAEKYAKINGYRSIYLYTHPIHKPAIRLYQKCGYRQINEFPDYYSNGDKSLLFGKVPLQNSA